MKLDVTLLNHIEEVMMGSKNISLSPEVVIFQFN